MWKFEASLGFQSLGDGGAECESVPRLNAELFKGPICWFQIVIIPFAFCINQLSHKVAILKENWLKKEKKKDL